MQEQRTDTQGAVRLPAGWKVPDYATLIGVDGNAFSVIGYVRRELERAGNDQAVLDDYTHQATSGDYQHLMWVSMAFIGEGGGTDDD